jgi:[ribosomal protein S18]-alanine N-acetyltransferase
MGAETKPQHVGATLRAFLPADAMAVTEILKESPQAADWTEGSFGESARWRGIVALVSEDHGKVTGFLIGRQVADEAEILNLAISVVKRRKGKGGALLKAAMHEFRARQVSRVFLEVRESNESGIAFYEKYGFSETGRRPGYYHNPDEAAIVMEKKLKV